MVTRIIERISIRSRAVEVIETFAQDPSHWISPFFKIAAFEGERIGEEVRVSMGMERAPSDDHLVLIEFERPQPLIGGGVVFPFRWRAAGLPALFSSFAGRIVIWPRFETETWLVIEGEASADSASNGASTAIMRRAASAAIRSLAGNLKAAFEESLRL